MSILKEIESKIAKLLKEYDSALEKGESILAQKATIEIEKELQKIRANEIKLITTKEDQSTTTVQ